jgi:hypothetical protein
VPRIGLAALLANRSSVEIQALLMDFSEWFSWCFKSILLRENAGISLDISHGGFLCSPFHSRLFRTPSAARTFVQLPGSRVRRLSRTARLLTAANGVIIRSARSSDRGGDKLCYEGRCSLCCPSLSSGALV